MNYYNIQHKDEVVSFKDATIKGLGRDKGLFVPERIPVLPISFFEEIEQLSDKEVATTALYPYVEGSMRREQLSQLLEEVFTFHTPVVELRDNLSVLELFHGPTMAFKDVGARFMARCLGAFADKSKPVTVLVATSGDTGSAVAHGFYGVEGVRVVILFPKGKVSAFQQWQMCSLGKNITAVAVEGTFDDCQALVKQALHDERLNEVMALSSANSINVARFLPQMLYYFFAYKQVKSHLKGRKWVVSVPSGNFGNITAGLYAQAMGLPIAQFIAANNANDTFYEYTLTGDYKAKPSVSTYSNAMDVGDPSNFARIQELFGGEYALIKEKVLAHRVSDAQTLSKIAEVAQQGYVLDPHGAVALTALEHYLKGGQYGTFLATAHPQKFDAVLRKVLPDFKAPEVDLEGCSALQIPNDYKVYLKVLGVESRE